MTTSGNSLRQRSPATPREAQAGEAWALAYTTAGDGRLFASVDATIFVVAVVVVVFAADILFRWWRENDWRRRWKRGAGNDEDGGD